MCYYIVLSVIGVVSAGLVNILYFSGRIKAKKVKHVIETNDTLFHFNYQNFKQQLKDESNRFSKYLPIVYNSNYDINFWGLQTLHPFDTQKWANIFDLIHKKLKDREKSSHLITISPLRQINLRELSLVHTEKFLQDIHNSRTVIADAAQVWILSWCPISIIRSKLLDPLKWQTSGSILAAHQALTNGWAINLGGGFHHCSHSKAQGFCLFADITLIMEYLWANYNKDLRKTEKVYILDMFNEDIYPRDSFAKSSINRLVELHSNTGDEKYLDLLDKNLKEAFIEFKPDLIIYNAGTDILRGDPLGRLSVTADGIIKRDQKVFTFAKENRVPIVMLTSGGYQQSNAEIIATSIAKLLEENLISFTSKL